MRTIEYGTTTHVPAFLTKLWKLVTDLSCDELISWSLAGTSFIIYDEIRFSKELLPMYFKHNNMASFVRQLNMYGFRKLSCIDQGGMHCYKNEIEFYHQYFLKGQESLLELIKRKIPTSKSEEPKLKQEYVDELISNIKTLKGKQDCAEQGMRHLKRENRMLWRHIHLLTDRYAKQQNVLQQFLPLFMDMVRTNRRDLTLKRKSPLMIDEGERQSKIARTSPPYLVHEQDSNPGLPSSPGNVTNRGPVIHDVTEMESSSKMFPGIVLSPPTNTPKECKVIVDSPLSCSLESSEQTSPFTEPGSMETFNILNQNYERRSRSNSLSPSMERSQMTSNSPLQLPSPRPRASSSVSSYSKSSIPPIVIIDETTSDVPISNNLMHNQFVPKIEETTAESGIYTMDSLIGDRVASIINEETVSSMLAKEASVLNGEVPAPILNECASTSEGNKFGQNNFMANVKSDMTEMNWLMNQPAPSFASAEPSFENWLGQIFKADNLTAGCSLPQPQQPQQSSNINFM